MRHFLPAARMLASNRATVDLTKQLASRYHALFGPRSARDLMVSAAVTGYAVAEWARIRYRSDVRHPGRNLLRYRWERSEKDVSLYMKPALAPEA
jgi:hypothetical protein